ncbi:addiction module antidote protein [Agrobacterium larrymoorei]|uniref:addiction module antidote protein n=1 Tax=Agrobacterium larrymoorei TaxID=160699 RepID=UPI0030C2649D
MTEISDWDPVDYLESDEAVVAYLEASFEDGDPRIIAVALGNIARAKGMSQIAKEAGITREALYKSLSDKGDPKLSTLLGVMRALGLRLSVTSVQEAA